MKRHIQLTPENRPPLDNLKGTPVFAEVMDYLKRPFIACPNLEIIIKRPVNLNADLAVFFGDKYPVADIMQLLEKGFLQEDGNYHFKRDSFCRIIKTHFITETAPAVMPAQEVEEVQA